MYIILHNLSVNAINFATEGGKIHVVAKQIADGISISVKDDGMGMSHDDISRILRKTEAFSKKGTNHERGTGLGLVIVGEFLEMNKGRMEIKSEIDHGSDFTVIFPKVDINKVVKEY